MTRAGQRPRHRWFAAAYDRFIEPSVGAHLAPLRQRAAGEAYGHVLELGAGAGSNLQFYDWTRVETLALTEPDLAMLDRLRPRIQALSSEIRSRVQVHETQAGKLPFADSVFDCAVVTLVLCAVEDLEASLAELRRVLKPGGELRLVEHVAAPGGLVAAQKLVQPAYKRMTGGRHLDRNITEALRRSGFSLRMTEVTRIGGPMLPFLAAVARSPVDPTHRPMPARTLRRRKPLLRRGRHLIDRHFLRQPGRYASQALLAAIVLAAVVAIEDALANAAIVTAIASSAFIIFMGPHSDLAGPRRVIGGHAAGVVIGLCGHVVAQELLAGAFDTNLVTDLTAAVAVGVGMLLMAATNTEHPPAAGTILGLVLAPSALANGFLVLVAAVVLSIARLLFKRWMINLAH